MRYLVVKYDFESYNELNEQIQSRADKGWRIKKMGKIKEYKSDPGIFTVEVLWKKKGENFGKC